MNLQESIMGDEAPISNPYPGMYAQGQRYQDIQNMMAPQYSQESPTSIYKQARADLESLASPSVPEFGLLGDSAHSPKARTGNGNAALFNGGLLGNGGLMGDGYGDGSQGANGPGVGGGFGAPGFGAIGAMGMLGLLGPVGSAVGKTAQMASLMSQNVDPAVAMSYLNPFGNTSKMDVVMNAMRNISPEVEAGLGIGFGYSDNDAENMGFGTIGQGIAAMGQSDAQAAENEAQGGGGGVGGAAGGGVGGGPGGENETGGIGGY
ncbi:MAG: hypothetical protein GY942_20105 [Aestuariibacter sp.]|nr:hypothetical protein [Aestuariibacter sp.]